MRRYLPIAVLVAMVVVALAIILKSPKPESEQAAEEASPTAISQQLAVSEPTESVSAPSAQVASSPSDSNEVEASADNTEAPADPDEGKWIFPDSGVTIDSYFSDDSVRAVMDSATDHVYDMASATWDSNERAGLFTIVCSSKSLSEASEVKSLANKIGIRLIVMDRPLDGFSRLFAAHINARCLWFVALGYLRTLERQDNVQWRSRLELFESLLEGRSPSTGVTIGEDEVYLTAGKVLQFKEIGLQSRQLAAAVSKRISQITMRDKFESEMRQLGLVPLNK